MNEKSFYAPCFDMKRSMGCDTAGLAASLLMTVCCTRMPAQQCPQQSEL